MIQDFFTAHSYLIGLISFFLGLIGMPLVIRIAKAKGFVVRPNKRMSHTGNIPNIGGLNIYFSFMLTYLLFEYDQLNQSQFFLIGLLAIMAVGFVDDVLVLTPTAKLLGETLAGIALVGFADMRITHLHGIFGIEEIGVIPSYMLSLFVLLAIINAVNLIDGIDGLAGGLSLLALAGFLLCFMREGILTYSILIAGLMGVLVPYLYFNILGDPAKNRKIFMGDSGSLTLGFILGFLFVKFSMVNQNVMAFHKDGLILSITMLIVPTFDVVRVVILRILHRRHLFQADKNHIHHKLMRMGLSQHQALGIIIAVAIGFTVLNALITLAFDLNLTYTLIIDIILFILFNQIIDAKIRRRGSVIFE